MQVGQVYGSTDGFKEASRNWAIPDHFEYQSKFNNG